MSSLGQKLGEASSTKKKDKKPIGELSCEVCMRAVDNIYADVHELAQAWAKAHGATPGGEDADDIVQQALGRACATVSPKAVRRAFSIAGGSSKKASSVGLAPGQPPSI